MKVEDIGKVTVLGAGAMGHGIAQVFAQNGYQVTMVDIKEEFLQAGMDKIKWSLGKLLQKGRITQEQHDATLQRLTTTVDRRSAVSDTDLVVEAIPEKLDLKREVFADVDAHAPSHAILATNTSALPIAEIAQATKRPEKVVGMHFMNPPQLMRLVEVIKSEQTTEEVAQLIYDLSVKLGKEPVLCRKDVPGFIANGVMMFPLNFVGQLLDSGRFKPEEIDSAAHFRMGNPMGILGLLDFVGIDVAYNVLRFMASRIPRMKVAKSIEERVKRGDLGVKTGRGFYEYPDKRWRIPSSWSEELADRFDAQMVVCVAINRAAALVDEEVATPQDIDKTLKLGFNLPIGMLALADQLGIDEVVKKLDYIADEYDRFYTPHPLLRRMVEENHLGRKTGQGFYKY